MTEKTNKKGFTKSNRPAKGQRTYVRRMKQTARKDGSVYRSPNAHRAPLKKAGE
jgi:hypothetical protein